MTGKISSNWPLSIFFSKFYFVSVFERKCLIGFVAQLFRPRFHQSYQCRNNNACAISFFCPGVGKNGVISNTFVTSSRGAKQYILSFQIQFNNTSLILLQLVVFNFV